MSDPGSPVDAPTVEALVFRLYGPMAAWGDIAVGERRPAHGHPTKSAVLGLVAAALGLDRHDEEGHAALFRGYGFAVRIDRPGLVLSDYHTAQVRPRGRDFPTRRDELNAPKDALTTILSQRLHQVDAVHTVCLTARDGARWSLEGLAAALDRPRYVLSLGRKSCPPALPLAPVVMRGVVDVLDALERLEPPPVEPQAFWTTPRAPVRLAWEAGMPGAPVDGHARLERIDTVVRRDRPLSRRRWQFAERAERIATIRPATARPTGPTA